MAISTRLAADGVAVAVFDVNGPGAQETAAKIGAAGGKAIGLTVDISARPEVEAAVAEVASRLGVPSILVNNAGAVAFDSFLDITGAEWDRMIAVNLTGTFNCCQVVIPLMLEQGWGRIVNISSSSTHSGTRRQAHYVASKSGVNGLTKCLALEFGASGITVNAIPPGFVDTPGLRKADAEGSLSIEQVLTTTPVGRPGRPEDIAATCAFLASEEASYITGQIIGVNGGRNT
jgi:NAD(P)-dependent dehydrogenase (short-subunit alcohol dehydrogenase family)